MKLQNCYFINFGSYHDLAFDFTGQGLTLISGSTGVGKSTVMDAVAWALYGVTAKDIKSDEVRTWGSSEDTVGFIKVVTSSDTILIHRKRSLKTGGNDLHFNLASTTIKDIRGKDLQETQQLLNSYLGLDYDTFVAGCYFHEFSPTAAFFTAKAKDRRELFEKLAVLDLPNRLSDRSSEARKEAKQNLETIIRSKERVEGKEEQTLSQLNSAINNFETWEIARAKKVVQLERLSASFDKDNKNKYDYAKSEANYFEEQRKKDIQILKSSAKPNNHYDKELAKLDNIDVPNKCPTCNQNILCEDTENRRTQLRREQMGNIEVLSLIEHKKSQPNPHVHSLDKILNEVNTYEFQIKEEQLRVNPWGSEQERLANILVDHQEELKKINKDAKEQQHLVSCYGTLKELSAKLRGELLESAVRAVEEETNKLLHDYFVLDYKIALQLNGADDISLQIFVGSHSGSYKQLSKGQRGILKLCFGVAVMTIISNSSGVHFENLFFDESLDGLDIDLKIKSFSLFQHLMQNRDSIMVIDHAPEFQNLFDNRYKARIENEVSILEAE